MTAFSPPVPDLLRTLGHDLRWQLVTALSRSDLRVRELVEQVRRPQNLVSYHLNRLRLAGLIRETRSIADGRETYYSLDLDRMKALLNETGSAIHPGLDPAPVDASGRAGSRPVRILFLCTHNSARSQMAEGLLRSLDGSGVLAFSAGTEPATVHPLAVRAMDDLGIDITGQHAKTLDLYRDEPFDYVITVCDRARENCPIFPGHPEQIHWSFPDPAAAEGPEETRFQAFRETALQLKTRIVYFLLMLERSR
ncbi:MAG TPA: ArsR family transcriptional regulator [Anaerolineales bacterium]|nr:ArsR family transcriptional regulator [Anaerolineales bacterium]